MVILAKPHQRAIGWLCVVALTDEQITKMAKARVSFKVHLFVYIVVNLFLMAIWMMTNGDNMPMYNTNWDAAYYWPMWTHLGWGIGLAFHGFAAYGQGPGMQEREEAKIRQQVGKN